MVGRSAVFCTQHLFSESAGPVLTEKFLDSGWIAERFRAATIGSRKRSAQVSMGETARDIRSAQKLMEETGVEAISGSNRIDNRHGNSRCAESPPVLDSNGSAGTHFHHDGLHFFCQPGSAVSKSPEREIFIASRSFGSRMST